MSSSFRRSGRPTQNLFSSSSSNSSNTQQSRDSLLERPLNSAAVLERVGTKPWIGGLTLTSTGLRELDAIVGGGQPLGTVILVEEDRWTQDLALCLVRYWSAEALAQGQTLALVSTLQDVTELDLNALDHDATIRPNNIQGMSPCGLASFLQMLPRNLHLEKAREKTRLLERRLQEQQGVAAAAAADGTTTHKTETATASGAISSLLDFGAIPEEEDDNFDLEDETTGTMDDANASNVDSDEGLVNAWQYKVSVQRQRMGDFISVSKSSSPSSVGSGGSGQDKIFCHSYDLGGKMVDQHDEQWQNPKANPHIEFIDCSCAKCPPLSCAESKDCAVALYQSLLLQIQQQMTQYPKTVIRLLLLNAPVKKVALALPLLLSYIRQHSLPVVMFVTVRPWQSTCAAHSYNHHNHQSSFTSNTISHTQALVSLRRVCDAVFTCEGFSAMVSPPPLEFSDLAGILSIRKIALQALSHFSDTTTSRRPPANRYGMKRDRRKMTIRMLHLPPEDFSAGGSSVGSGVRSGGGKLKESKRSGSNSDRESGKSSTSKATALVPGMGCASHHMRSSNSSQSLDF